MSLIAAFALISALTAAAPQAAAPADAWAPYRFLIGEWTGDGQGQPGNSTGAASFKIDLEGRIIVRTSRAAVAASAGRPASVHEDRMVIFRDAPGQPVKAVYWDNEDHTIYYDVSASPDGNSVVFVTRLVAGAPRFRLVYTKLDRSTVDVKFEMAPPGNPDAFKTYTQGVTKRVN